MWYKYNEETNEWYRGSEIHLPNGVVLREDNHNQIEDGWEWHENEPLGYTLWVKEQSIFTP